jgi:hypothetical protein
MSLPKESAQLATAKMTSLGLFEGLLKKLGSVRALFALASFLQ